MVDWVVSRRVDEFLPCGKPDSNGTGLGVRRGLVASHRL